MNYEDIASIPLGTRVEVYWGDAWGTGDNFDATKEYVPDPAKSLGYLMQVNPEAVTIIMISPAQDAITEEYRDVLVIPTSWITQVKKWV